MNKKTALALLTFTDIISSAKKGIESIRKKIVEEATPLSPERYDQLASGLRELLKTKTCSNPHEEFLRRAATGESHHRTPATPENIPECIAFLKTFDDRKNEISRTLDSIDTERKGDGHYDLIDALALAPEPFLKEIREDSENYLKIERKWKKDIKDIIEAEYYNEMMLKKALETFLPFEARKHIPEPPEKKGQKPKLPGRIKITQVDKGHTRIQLDQYGASPATIMLPQKELLLALTGKTVAVTIQISSSEQAPRIP